MPKRRKKVKKEHLKDIDFRTRRKRQDEWQIDWGRWLDDLQKRKGVVAKTQEELLTEWWQKVEIDPETATEYIETQRAEANIKTEKGLAKYLLACSCLWYLT
jgi:hypothetical protein